MTTKLRDAITPNISHASFHLSSLVFAEVCDKIHFFVLVKRKKLVILLVGTPIPIAVVRIVVTVVVSSEPVRRPIGANKIRLDGNQLSVVTRF